MAGILSQKERTILQDQSRHEEVCVKKYQDYAKKTSDTALRGLFNEFAQDEQQHYNTLQGMLSGSSQGQQPQPQRQQQSSRELFPMFRSETSQELYSGMGTTENDASVVRDMLMTEQFVSNSYDSAIFDSVCQEVRQTLQHIQKDEQKHGQGLRDYMQQKGLNQQ